MLGRMRLTFLPRISVNERISSGSSGIGGFTLPELLITILLISILFTLGLLFSTGMRQTRKMRDYEIAIALARQAIEVLRSAPFELIDDADAGPDSIEHDLNTGSGDGDLLEPEFTVNMIRYERSVEVLNVEPIEEDGIPPGLKYVKVIVHWQAPDGTEIVPYEIVTTISNLN